jgi:hypothetical protein
MITKTKKIRSNHLDLQTIENKQLSIQFSLGGFSFSIFDLDLLEFVVFYKYKFDKKTVNADLLLRSIKTLFIKEELLRLKFSKVNIVHVNNISAFVPKAIFKKSDIANYIKFNNKIFDSDFFAHDAIQNQDMMSVYVPYVNINNFFIDQFGTFNYRHYSSILVENLLSNYTKNEDLVFFVNVANSHFEIIVSQHKKLLFYNTFKYKTKEDFIYYILFTVQQLDLNVEEVKLKFLGEIKNTNKLYYIAYKYIRHVSFLDIASKYNFYLYINMIEQRENFTLFHSIS